MFAGPLANFILAILIFSFIFSSTPDPKSIIVIDSTNDTSTFNQGDQIISIDSVNVYERKDISLELLSKAGMSGQIAIDVYQVNLDQTKTITLDVDNFLTDSKQQENPVSALGISIKMKSLPIIGSILPGGAAEKAGLMVNDQIISINNSSILYASEISPALNALNTNFVDIEVLRGNKTNIIPVELNLVQNTEGIQSRLLGIQFGLKRSFFASFIKGSKETYNLSVKTLQFIGKMLTGNMGTENLSGPIGIAKMAGDTAQAGILPFLYLMALLSISLGVLNLLPIPALDGGQLTLLGVEAIRGSPLPDKVENFVYATGTVMIIFLMVFAVFNDVARF
jgi:regulator of sigma E protease